MKHAHKVHCVTEAEAACLLLEHGAFWTLTDHNDGAVAAPASQACESLEQNVESLSVYERRDRNYLHDAWLRTLFVGVWRVEALRVHSVRHGVQASVRSKRLKEAPEIVARRANKIGCLEHSPCQKASESVHLTRREARVVLRNDDS
jgi:hypothetical protein